jgi:hypothetical protein
VPVRNDRSLRTRSRREQKALPDIACSYPLRKHQQQLLWSHKGNLGTSPKNPLNRPKVEAHATSRSGRMRTESTTDLPREARQRACRGYPANRADLNAQRLPTGVADFSLSFDRLSVSRYCLLHTTIHAIGGTSGGVATTTVTFVLGIASPARQCRRQRMPA